MIDILFIPEALIFVVSGFQPLKDFCPTVRLHGHDHGFGSGLVAQGSGRHQYLGTVTESHHGQNIIFAQLINDLARGSFGTFQTNAAHRRAAIKDQGQIQVADAFLLCL